MPTLGNGMIAVTVYDDALYFNGLYAGEGGECTERRGSDELETKNNNNSNNNNNTPPKKKKKKNQIK